MGAIVATIFGKYILPHTPGEETSKEKKSQVLITTESLG